LLPYLPGRNNEGFHEVDRAMSLSSLFKGGKEVCLVVSVDVNLLPASLAKWTVKEKMESCLFSFQVTMNTIIVIVSDFEVLTLENVSCI
jgi:hypothetical protein